MRGCNHVHKPFVTILILALMTALTSCASSNVSRTAASNADMGFDNAEKLGTKFSNGDVVESYQNSSQAAKGALLGGAAGALTGAASSSVGFVPGMLTGMIVGASYGAYIDSQSTVGDQLENRGATIVELGDQILLVIPSARIFEGMTDSIKPQGYSTLNLATAYLNKYTTTLVKISAYTDDIGEQSSNLALSKQQAHRVERYFVSNGLNTRVLYADGYGGRNLVMKNTEEWGRSDNYRIEITLEKLAV
jgi:outer membrane protein OmpA-like peptidoglycan-associated protein